MKIVCHSTIVHIDKKPIYPAQHWAVGMESSPGSGLYEWIEVTSTPKNPIGVADTEVDIQREPAKHSYCNGIHEYTVQGEGDTAKSKEELRAFARRYEKEYTVYRVVGEAGRPLTEGRNCQDFSCHFFRYAGCESNLNSRQGLEDLGKFLPKIEEEIAKGVVKAGREVVKVGRDIGKIFGF